MGLWKPINSFSRKKKKGRCTLEYYKESGKNWFNTMKRGK
jgi:hypothetical protein